MKGSQINQIAKVFDEAECTGCHTFLPVSEPMLRLWRFSMGGLAPNMLKVAKGLCPVCQVNQVLFEKVLRD